MTTTAAAPAILQAERELWAIDRLIPYARNSKRHPPKQIAEIKASIETFGFTIPVLVDEGGTVIAGHGRIMAAKELGMAALPVIVARGWSEAMRRAYTIADNRLTEKGEWDEELLRVELADLKETGFAIDLTGFSEQDLDAMLSRGDGAGDQPKAPGSLAARFGIPPFSVLNAREGWWQDRKRAWIDLGIRSELGRGETGVNTPRDGSHSAADLSALRETRARAKANAVPGGAPMPLDRAKNKANATPGGSKMPAANYSKTKARGDGRGKAVPRG